MINLAANLLVGRLLVDADQSASCGRLVGIVSRVFTTLDAVVSSNNLGHQILVIFFYAQCQQNAEPGDDHPA